MSSFQDQFEHIADLLATKTLQHSGSNGFVSLKEFQQTISSGNVVTGRMNDDGTVKMLGQSNDIDEVNNVIEKKLTDLLEKKMSNMLENQLPNILDKYFKNKK